MWKLMVSCSLFSLRRIQWMMVHRGKYMMYHRHKRIKNSILLKCCWNSETNYLYMKWIFPCWVDSLCELFNCFGVGVKGVGKWLPWEGCHLCDFSAFDVANSHVLGALGGLPLLYMVKTLPIAWLRIKGDGHRSLELIVRNPDGEMNIPHTHPYAIFWSWHIWWSHPHLYRLKPLELWGEFSRMHVFLYMMIS